jgi:hypothetical protein
MNHQKVVVPGPSKELAELAPVLPLAVGEDVQAHRRLGHGSSGDHMKAQSETHTAALNSPDSLLNFKQHRKYDSPG